MTATQHHAALRALYAASPAERLARIETGLARAADQLHLLNLDRPGAADRIEALAGLLHAIEREARALLGCAVQGAA